MTNHAGVYAAPAWPVPVASELFSSALLTGQARLLAGTSRHEQGRKETKSGRFSFSSDAQASLGIYMRLGYFGIQRKRKGHA